MFVQAESEITFEYGVRKEKIEEFKNLKALPFQIQVLLTHLLVTITIITQHCYHCPSQANTIAMAVHITTHHYFPVLLTFVFRSDTPNSMAQNASE